MQNELIRLGFSARMSAEKSDVGELDLYGQIISDMPESWKLSKDDKSASDFRKAIDGLKQSGAKKLFMRINSPGGVVSESVAMRSTIINAGFDAIDIRIEGWCASAATNIATIPGAHVEITPGSEYMIHNPWTLAIGNADEMESTAEHLRKLEKTTRCMYTERTGQSDEQVKAWMDKETWFSAEEAVQYGFCDAVTEEKAPGAKAEMRNLSAPMMVAMRGMYRNAPVQETAHEDESAENPAGLPVANKEKEVFDMNIAEITLDQLQQENPALIQQIKEAAVMDERQRVQDIDEATDVGCEAIAKQAVQEGKSIVEFVKMQVAHKKQKAAEEAQKGETFLQQRREEVAPAKEIAAENVDEESEEDAEEKAYLQMAKEFVTGSEKTGMY